MIDRDQLESVLREAEAPELMAVGAELQAKAFAKLVSANEDPLLEMSEVAKRLGIKEAHAREMGRRGELPTVLVGEKFVRVRRSTLEKWIAAREAGGRARS